MIVSAHSNRCFSRRLSRRDCARSAASEFGSAVLGPRLAGRSASKAPKQRSVVNAALLRVIVEGKRGFGVLLRPRQGVWLESGT
jgi:hypothetical protein